MAQTEEKPPFINPRVPFSRTIEGNLQDGMSITVCGKVLPNADRFNVNLQQGSEVVALQVNPRYQMLWIGPDYVVHNTRQNGTWGWEERKYETPFPRGQAFSLQILVTQESYKILTNGKLFSEYKHRIRFSDVDCITVVGMVELSFVTFHNLVPHQPALPGSLMVPYKNIIYGGVQPGKCIIIEGVINQQAKRVEFRLRHKTGIAFYYIIPFDGNAEGCNNYGECGIEEQSGLFKRGQSFQVTICCSLDNYEVFVKDKRTHTYSHQNSNLEEIDVLEISGDVQLSFVQP